MLVAIVNGPAHKELSAALCVPSVVLLFRTDSCVLKISPLPLVVSPVFPFSPWKKPAPVPWVRLPCTNLEPTVTPLAGAVVNVRVVPVTK